MGISFLRQDNITAGAFAHAKGLNGENLNIALAHTAAISLVDVVWVTEKVSIRIKIVI